MFGRPCANFADLAGGQPGSVFLGGAAVFAGATPVQLLNARWKALVSEKPTSPQSCSRGAHLLIGRLSRY